MEPIDSLVKFLQSCLSPIVLISGVGFLLLSLINRLARTIDKSRMIVKELENKQVAEIGQISHLWIGTAASFYARIEWPQ